MPDFTKDELRETIADLERLGGPELLLTPSDLGVLEHARFALAQVEALEQERRERRGHEESVSWLLHQMRKRDLDTIRDIGNTYPTDKHREDRDA